MNINYLRLDGPLPRYADGWQSVLGALRGGRFFTTTGEVLIPEFTIGGAQSGEETVFGRNSLVRAKIEWTFPPAFAEIDRVDGNKVDSDRTEFTGAPPFGTPQPHTRDYSK